MTIILLLDMNVRRGVSPATQFKSSNHIDEERAEERTIREEEVSLLSLYAPEQRLC